MKKTAFCLLMLFLSSQTGYCTLTNSEVNIYNLKQKNVYMLNLSSSVKNINISNKDIVSIIPVTTIDNDKKQLFIEANETGICDVVLTTDSESYKIRFISGPVFEDNKKSELIQIDKPADFENGINE